MPSWSRSSSFTPHHPHPHRQPSTTLDASQAFRVATRTAPFECAPPKLPPPSCCGRSATTNAKRLTTLSAFARLSRRPSTTTPVRTRTRTFAPVFLSVRYCGLHVGAHFEATARDRIVFTGIAALSPSRQDRRPDKARCSSQYSDFTAVHVDKFAAQWRPRHDRDRSSL